MKVPGFILKLFIDKVLKQLLDGDKGSTVLTLILTPVVAAGINWPLALQGLTSQESALELAKVVGLVACAVWGWFIGRKQKTKA